MVTVNFTFDIWFEIFHEICFMIFKKDSWNLKNKKFDYFYYLSLLLHWLFDFSKTQ